MTSYQSIDLLVLLRNTNFEQTSFDQKNSRHIFTAPIKTSVISKLHFKVILNNEILINVVNLCLKKLAQIINQFKFRPSNTQLKFEFGWFL